MLQLIPSSYAKYWKNSLSFSANTYEKYIVSKEYCIAQHNVVLCGSPNCRFHNFLLGNIEVLLQHLAPLSFTHQHVDCLYTLFEYRFGRNFVVKTGQVFDTVQRAVNFNRKNKRVDRMPSFAKKRLSRKKYRKHSLSSFQQTKSTPTSESVFAGRIEQVEKI